MSKTLNIFCLLCRKRERWGLTWQGHLLVCFLTGIAGCVLWFGIHPFLAVTKRVSSAKVLVVEGWVHEASLRAAVKEFNSGNYKLLITTGGPMTGYGGYTTDSNTTAAIAAGRLIRYGISSNSIEVAPTRISGRDRTYSAAKALGVNLSTNKSFEGSFNLLTEDAHARRTWLMFKKALGDAATIGIISVPSSEFDGDHWWRFSEGVREVVGEALAYGYSLLLFTPTGIEGKEPQF